MTSVTESFAAGYASLSAWADLLDRINVFPVADGDTGTNLRISLAPLHAANQAGPLLAQRLPQHATGNSGNIAAAFFQEFCQAEQVHELADTAASGRDRAWHAIADPCPGTMLSVFDALAANLSPQPDAESLYSPLCASLQEAVCNTRQQLPDLKLAGVVDSGALAMYVFFDAFFHHLTAQPVPAVSIFKLFEGNLEISDSYVAKEITSHCVDVVVQANQAADSTQDFKNNLTRLGESVVVVEDEAAYKVHLHTPDPVALRNRLDSLGNVVQWSEEKIVQSLSQNAFSPE
ncbi:MAG: DAK2 domain-containing protein, partial [Desulfocapsaceae bacterium]|nr:DAK2 domain-containing protein [Desulfocapsaceae bacterium]